jgi:uncharacterized protein (TIGR00255 family)
MTGFGRAEAQRTDLHVWVEIKAFNNRYLEISSKVSPSLSEFELRAKEIIRKYLDRGRIFLLMNDLSPRFRLQAIRLDESLSRSLVEHLKKLNASLGLKSKISIEHLLPFLEQLQLNELNEIQPELLEVAEEAMKKALEQLNIMRRQEGRALKEDLLQRLDILQKAMSETEQLAYENSKRRRESLQERIKSLLALPELDPNRMELEVALLADRLDITEELVRLKSHCEQFRKMVENGGPCGRRLNFLVQEMNRELNTTSAKAVLPEISHLVVEMKEELERMREQAQNVE